MNENTNITINGNVTINANGTESQAKQEERQPIDRTHEVLISNETSFFELINILRGKPEAAEAAAQEADEKARKTKEAEQRRLFGDDYELMVGKKMEMPEKGDTRPRPGELRNYVPMVAKIEFPSGGYCEVYSNGYAIYDNGNRKTVLWVPDCSSVTYYFGPLKDKEKEYLDQKKEISEDELGPLPWYHAVMIGGEDRIEYNMEHPKSKGSASDMENPEEWEQKANFRWNCGVHFDSPEEAYIRKEEAEERKKKVRDEVKKLRKTQREAIEMCFFEEMTQEAAAQKLGKSQSSVNGRIRTGKEALAKTLKNIF